MADPAALQAKLKTLSDGYTGDYLTLLATGIFIG